MEHSTIPANKKNKITTQKEHLCLTLASNERKTARCGNNWREIDFIEDLEKNIIISGKQYIKLSL